jgi:hypothetical protein
MAITSAIANSYKQDILKGIQLAADVYKMALYLVGATLDKDTTAYTAGNEVASGNGYTTGGAAMANFTVTLSGNTAVLTFNNQVWANATFTAAGCMIYNTNRTNNCVAVFSFGGNVTATGANFTVVMPVADAANGLIRIA